MNLSLRLPRLTSHAALATRPVDIFNPFSRQTASRWVVHFLDRDPRVVTLPQAATHEEILASCPDAIAAEPVKSIHA